MTREYCAGKPDTGLTRSSGLEGAGRKRTSAMRQRAALRPYAKHLHEAGVDIRYIQELLGHDDIRTTAKYTKVSKVNLRNVRSPLDELPTASGGLDDEVLAACRRSQRVRLR